MIPVRLQVRGFLSYREMTDLSFLGFDLACISGSNGAGKSSLLDAITWVLFGKARRNDDAVIHNRSQEKEIINPANVVIVEGIMIFAIPELKDLFDIKIFVDTPDDIRFIRRLSRDIKHRGRTVDSVVNQYLATVRPMHLLFVEPSKKYADIIIPEGGENHVAIDFLVTKIVDLFKK